MKIGTLSFEIGYSKSDELKMRLPGGKRLRLLESILQEHAPDVLVCAGFTLESETHLKELSDFLKKKKWRGIIFLEVQNSSRKYVSGQGSSDLKHVAFLWLGNQWKKLGSQVLVTHEHLRDPERVGEFEKKLVDFKFELRGLTFGVLTCGEIMSFPCSGGVASPKTKPIDEWFNGNADSQRIDVLVNPTHDRMSEQGGLTAKREFLSQNGRLYISSSNWNSEKSPAQKPSWPSLHSIFEDGKKVAHFAQSNSLANAEYEYREYDAKLTWPK